MKHDCTTCFYSPNCGTDGNQCADYREATKKEVKKQSKNLKDMLGSAVDISEYDKQDAETRKQIDLFDEDGYSTIPRRE